MLSLTQFQLNVKKSHSSTLKTGNQRRVDNNLSKTSILPLPLPLERFINHYAILSGFLNRFVTINRQAKM